MTMGISKINVTYCKYGSPVSGKYSRYTAMAWGMSYIVRERDKETMRM